MRPLARSLSAPMLAGSLLGGSLLAGFLLTPTAAAIQPQPAGLAAAVAAAGLPEPHLVQATSPERSAAIAEQDPALAAWRADAGGTWHARYDARTGRPALVWGSGVAWLPGRGNDLTWKDVTGTADEPAPSRVLEVLESKARALLAEHGDLFRLPASLRLVVDERRSVRVGGKWQLHLALERAALSGEPAALSGEPAALLCEGAALVFRLSHGNLVQFGSLGVHESLAAAPIQPQLDAASALAAAYERLAAIASAAGLDGSGLGPARPVDAPRLRLLVAPIRDARVGAHDAHDPREWSGAWGEGVATRLAWRVIFRAGDSPERWAADVDATSGEVLSLFDRNFYACPPPAEPQGRVTGGVLLGPIEEVVEQRRGMPFARVEHGGAVSTSFDGLFPLTPGTVSSTGLDGTFFDTECESCTNPSQAFVADAAGGELALGVGGPGRTGNGFSTAAERNAYYHLSITRRLAARHLDDAATNGYLTDTIRTSVNLEGGPCPCNAFYDGGVNFCLAGSGCNNTGLIADVMQHEWGHGLDFATGYGGDGARGEGLSDVVAFLATHDARLGPYFFAGNPNGIRNADEAVGGVLSLDNVASECPAFGNTGPAGTEIHCEGVILSQTFWHLARELVAAKGEVAGWFLAEKLFFQSLPFSTTYVPDQMGSTYDAAVLIDDDDGDLANGTPNGSFIDEAFLHHAIASTPQAGDSADCVPPAAASVTLTAQQDAATEQWQVAVSWSDVPGAVDYLVSRNDADGRGADIGIATVAAPATTFLDDAVIDGVTYAYRVVAIDAAGCVSGQDVAEQVSVGDLPALAIQAFDVSDLSGNFNGVPEPGEPLDLTVSIRNAGTRSLTSVVGTLTSPDPLVTVTQDTTSFGDLPLDATAAGDVALQFQLDPSLPCGGEVVLVLDLEGTEGCSRVGFTIDVGELVDFDLREQDDVESAAGWTVDPDGTDDAVAGAWVHGDPNGTFFGAFPIQPDADHTPDPGVNAWITGNAAGVEPDEDDVDGGCTTLLGPAWDLGGESGLEVTYWRSVAFGFDVGGDLLVELSNDGGGSWIELERVEEFEPAWTQRVFVLDDVLGEPAASLRLRFTACDTGPDSLLEAAIDDVSVRAPVFACEAPDPRPRLRLTGASVLDDPALPGVEGNDNGRFDAGETVRVALDVENFGNADGANGNGVAALASAPDGAALLDATVEWGSVAPGATARTSGPEPHLLVTAPWTASCGETLEGLVSIDYDGPAGSYTIDGAFSFTLGQSLLLADGFELGDAGWTHGTACGGGGCDPQDDWQRGPMGGASAFDPSEAFEGESAWANDRGATIGGQPWNGDYRSNVDNWLESPPIDVSAVPAGGDVVMRFRRWLTVQDAAFDQARILVDGAEAWANPTGADFIDTDWVEHEVSLTPFLAGQSDLRVRFTLTADDSVQMGGWTIDDLRVAEQTPGCPPFCVDATLPEPVGATALRVRLGAGIELSWIGESLGPSEIFRVYRGDSPDGLDELLTGADFTSPAYSDRSPPPLAFYRVTRAACAGEAPLAP